MRTHLLHTVPSDADTDTGRAANDERYQRSETMDLVGKPSPAAIEARKAIQAGAAADAHYWLDGYAGI